MIRQWIQDGASDVQRRRQQISEQEAHEEPVICVPHAFVNPNTFCFFFFWKTTTNKRPQPIKTKKQRERERGEGGVFFFFCKSKKDMQGLRPPPPITSSRSPSLLFKSSPSPLPLPRAPSHILFFIVVVFFTMMVHSRHTTSTNGTMFRPPWLLHFARSAKFYWRRRTPGNGQRFQFLIFFIFSLFFPYQYQKKHLGD